MDLDFIKDHIRNRPYMSGIERDKNRVKQTQECFTKDFLVQKACNQIEEKDPTAFSNPTKTFIDPTGFGDAQLLGEVLIRKLENGIDFKTALNSIFGVEKQADNVKLAHDRLLCGFEEYRWIVEKNLIQGDSLKIKNWDFDGKDPYKNEQDLHFDSLFSQEN